MKNHKRIPSMKLWHFLFLFGFPLSWGQDSEVSNTISKANELFNSEETVVSEMEYRKALSENPNRIEALYNLGNNKSISIKELVNKIKTVSGSKIPIIFNLKKPTLKKVGLRK